MNLQYYKLHPDVKAPVRPYEHDSGFDIFANETLVIPVGKSSVVKTDIVVLVPEGCDMMIRGKSGLAFTHRLHVYYGTIDEHYCGELGVLVYNFGDKDYHVVKGHKICQVVVLPKVKIDGVEELKSLPDYGKEKRGSRGYGHSGSV